MHMTLKVRSFFHKNTVSAASLFCLTLKVGGSTPVFTVLTSQSMQNSSSCESNPWSQKNRVRWSKGYRIVIRFTALAIKIGRYLILQFNISLHQCSSAGWSLKDAIRLTGSLRNVTFESYPSIRLESSFARSHAAQINSLHRPRQ